MDCSRVSENSEKIATRRSLQRKRQPSQGWYTGSNPVRAACIHAGFKARLFDARDKAGGHRPPVVFDCVGIVIAVIVLLFSASDFVLPNFVVCATAVSSPIDCEVRFSCALFSGARFQRRITLAICGPSRPDPSRDSQLALPFARP